MLMLLRPLLRLPPLLLLLPLVIGCASQWEQNFQPTEQFDRKNAVPVQEVEVRTVPMERIQAYEQAERQAAINSTTAPADWNPSERAQAEARLLRALQLPAGEGKLTVLGWSDFYTTSKPSGDALRDFARKIGANLVVVASAPAGQVTSIQQQPVQSNQDGFVRPMSSRRGRYAGGYFYSERSTTWVPVAVTENQTFYQAFFLHRSAP